MAGVEDHIQHLIHIGRKNGGVTREQVRKYVVDRGATPIDLVLTYFRLIQENIPILDPFQGMTFQTERRNGAAHPWPRRLGDRRHGVGADGRAA